MPRRSSTTASPYVAIAPLPIFSNWEGLASADALLVQDGQGVLQPGALLLALLAIASVAVLVGRRLSEYARRVGLLKAVGGTPSMVAATFLAENLVLALFAAVLGLVAGWLVVAAPHQPRRRTHRHRGRARDLTGHGGARSSGWRSSVALAATLVPAIRAARSSTVAALNDVGPPAAAPGRAHPDLEQAAGPGAVRAAAGRAPPSPCAAQRGEHRRHRHRHRGGARLPRLRGRQTRRGAVGLTAGGLSDPVINRDEQMLTVITIMLVTLAVLNALFTTWATVLDARRSSALMRALGARTRQVSSGLVVAQVLSALPGAILGIPLGSSCSRPPSTEEPCRR